MNILVIGHTVLDQFNADDNVIEKPGGIFYTATGMYLVKNDNDEIFLLTSMEDEKESLFESMLLNVNKSLIQRTDEIPRVNLTLCRNNERGEKYKNITAKLNVDYIPDYNMFDGILINMISGFDINLDDLEKIRVGYSGDIYIDIHTLSRGLDEDNNREFRKVPDAGRWLDAVDIVQVNESELLTITNAQTEEEQAKEVLGRRPHTLILTMGDKGVKMFYEKDGAIAVHYLPALKVNAINQIGCGDVFGAVFFYSYILNRNKETSLAKANDAAGFITTYVDFNNLERIKDDFLERFGER